MELLIGLIIVVWFGRVSCFILSEIIDLCKDIKREIKLYKNRKRLERYCT